MKEKVKEFKDLVDTWNLESALRVVDIDSLEDQELRTLCRKFKNLHQDILQKLNSASVKLTYEQIEG